MNNKTLFYAIISLVLLWSCSKDDNPEPPKNNAPVIEAQSFNAAEDISDNSTIGTVKATDGDKDDLTFSIKTNDNDLFEITDAGALSLATGKALDFSSKVQHIVTVGVTDGEDIASAQITINVTEVAPINQAPIILLQEFNVSEDIADTVVIGTVVATDPEDDALTFNITVNDSDLFEITEQGELSLIEGKSLDFEIKEAHAITISADDGINTSEAVVTIVVTNIVDSLAEDPASFVTVWKTETADEVITVGTNDDLDLTYDYTIDWGDGTVEDLTEGNPTHAYSIPGTYTVAIKGQFPSLRIDKDLFDFESVTSFISLEQWGAIQWKNLESAFHNCENMEYNAIDAPDLSEITSLWNMFRGARIFSEINLNTWDVGNVTNMTAVFFLTEFNLLDVSQWNVENVVYMSSMFASSSFNGDLSNWNVSNVEDMGGMFSNSPFNGDISSWNVSNVMDMPVMFQNASEFNQDISSWNVSNVVDMSGIFSNAFSFNQNLSNWEISSLAPGDPSSGLGTAFNNSGMSPENLSATLIGWANNPNTALGVACGIEGLSMCDENTAVEAFAKLAAELQWEFSSYPNLETCPEN